MQAITFKGSREHKSHRGLDQGIERPFDNTHDVRLTGHEQCKAHGLGASGVAVEVGELESRSHLPKKG
jgi:hypothetical protein